MSESYIPYGGYWSTPFARWQGSLADLHALKFAAHVAKNELEKREISPERIDFAVLGLTNIQHSSFFGLPWVTGMLGAPHVGGPTISQACATGARSVEVANHEVADGMSKCTLVLATDRCSNNAHVYYPAPKGPGGTGTHEDWVMDNFSNDPFARCAMIDTAENVAALHQFSTEAQHEVVLMRHEQYSSARARGFHETFMTLPFEVPDARFQKTATTMDGDEGVFPTDAEKLAKLKPVKEGGTVTFGGQTHPADGNAGMFVCDRDTAKELSKNDKIEIRVAGFGQARVKAAHMPMAPAPAGLKALEAAGISVKDLGATTTHDPFAVNDLMFSKETGIPLDRVNRNGASLIWGHPQGPTGLRAIIELIETLVADGGGWGLFSGCAAGDTGLAVVIEVTDAR